MNASLFIDYVNKQACIQTLNIAMPLTILCYRVQNVHYSITIFKILLPHAA